ncbi:GNAT family N-acetyltransferase [Actinoalloteichus fjordicus]|uniref:Acetyltransferase, ribosomal protein N-acetylase n=1 Tax=Actinoalloteichus fjordicus TaxID=1612552 RepID=A0AAC9L9U4_9PSEU|nr:GNAT family protein [Actinoalloteichus fjordicus]APU12475.1 acetyltransferase, ribosomal protein N-acetylase [Actinoalloteichus fjordicus]
MIRADVFRDQPVLHGRSIRLEPQTERHFDGIWRMLGDEESNRLTGTHQQFTEPQIRQWLATRREHHDRADWAVVRRADGAVVGEVVLNDLDPDNASVSFRIGLLGPEVFGRGIGTEATRLVVAYAFDVAGLHRISLDVFDFNPRARRVYEKCGFTVEGVHRDALRWEGRWHDALFMAMLSTDPRPEESAPA